jgi:hypothetical protein
MTITDDRDYDGLLARMHDRFAGYAAGPLFTTDADGAALYAAYLEALPAEWRQHHICTACRRFIGQYGGLVAVRPDGTLVSALWGVEDATPFYRPAVERLARLVERARITGVFLTDRRELGTPRTGEWTHFAVTATAIHRGVLTAHQAAAAKAEDYRTVCTALAEFAPPVVDQAVTLLQSERLYRAERVIGPATWLQRLHATRGAATDARARENLTWLAVATAPAGFCHPRSSMIGSLLEDIAAGLPLNDVQRRFAAKMDPAQYQRAQAAPAAGAIAQAEKLFAELGLAPALERRYARLDEVETIWRPAPAPKAAPASGGLFGHLTPRGAAAQPAVLELPAAPITWEKFQRVVLPGAQSIAALVPATASRFMALITAANADAPPLLQWDRDEARNPVSWYYAGGIDAEMRRRLTRAGGRFEGVDIRASLMWNNYNDLDLHVVTPAGQHIFYGNKHACRYGGYLDVDMNAGGGVTDEPVENTRWVRGSAPEGCYQVYANLYTTHRGCGAVTPFTVEIEVDGQVFTRTGMVRHHNSANRFPSMVKVADFTYRRGVPVDLASDAAVRPAATTPNAWGLVPGTYAPVTAIVPSPNLWGTQPLLQHGRHAFFLLDGCRDSQAGVGRGFFVETLRSELHPVRAVLEAYAATAAIAGAEQAECCGIGITTTATDNLTLRVTGPGGVAHYTIDRWD